MSSRNDQAWLKAAASSETTIDASYDRHEAKNLSLSERQQAATDATEAAHLIPFSFGNSSLPTMWYYHCR